jgi:hypothetical protein
MLFKLVYQTETVPVDEKRTIWDQFQLIEKMLDYLFETAEEHGFIGTPPSCSCTPEAHFEMETQIEETLDKIIELLE